MKRRGFTLIELMIVVAIIGILAAVAIPNFIRFQCKAKQSEAKGMLTAVRTTEALYSGEYGTFIMVTELTSFGGMDPKSVSASKFYGISTPFVNGTYYFAQASDTRLKVNSSSGLTDAWFVSATAPLVSNIANACD